MDGNYLLAAKSLHIIFVVAWFAGLFYIPRLFIYQTEAEKKPEQERLAVTDQLKTMTRRLWYIITWPALVIVFITAAAMLILYPPYLQMPWMHVKLSLVLLLFVYHLSLHWLYRKLQKDKYPWSSMRLRFYNEIATVLLFAIVFTAVFKNVSSWMYGAGGILALGVLLSLGIMFYRRIRKKKED